jgi:hypothetical protein
MQNFTSVSAGRNRGNLEKQVRLVLYARVWHGADFAVTSGSVGVAGQRVSLRVRGSVSASRSASRVWLTQAHL